MAEEKPPRSAVKDITPDAPDYKKGALEVKPQEDATAAVPAETKVPGVKGSEPKNAQTPEGNKSETQAPATEKPVKLSPPPRTSQYVVTLDNRTGLAVKIENLNEKTGEKTELSKEEYAAIMLYGRPVPTSAAKSALDSPMSSRAPSQGENAALTEAYYRGVTDYIKALTSGF